MANVTMTTDEFNRQYRNGGDAKKVLPEGKRVAASGIPSKTYHATLPYPPSTNKLHAVYRGRKILSSKGRAYYKEVEAYRPTIGPFAGRLTVTIKAWMPDNLRRDLSNILKALEDSMTHAGFWLDDSQICDLRIVRAGVEKPGRVEVYIQEIAGLGRDFRVVPMGNPIAVALEVAEVVRTRSKP